MYVFLVALMCVYIVVGVWVCITNYKGNRLKTELIDDLLKQNELLTEQNHSLKRIVRKLCPNKSD